MTRTSLLKWLERGLLAIGLALGLWCAVVLVRGAIHDPEHAAADS